MILTLLSACGSSSSDEKEPEKQPVETRTFKMGFTPWLYEASFEALDLVYDQIQQNGDIVSHHLMSGIPWQEAFDGTAYPANIETEINRRLSNTEAGKAVYLSIDSLDGLRTELAPNWGVTENEARTGVWASRNFSSPEVITAYVNFSLDMISRFEPDYFNYSVEVSVLMFNSSTNFNEFVTFAEQVYDRIKAVHPNLPMLVSLSLKTPGNAEMLQVKTDFARIASYVDIAGISVYPYAFYDHADKADPANMPVNWLTQIEDLAPGKPVAITEVGWAAEDLVISSFGINLPITEQNQLDFLQVLFEEAQDQDALFLIWFCIYDYDKLWDIFDPSAKDIGRIWRDIGLYDGALNPRMSLDYWQEWYQRPLQ